MVKIILGKNDLFTTNPELKEKWDFEKNTIKPTEITFGSHKKVWWKCEYGHSYDAQVKNVVWGRGCPFCSGKKIFIGENDLETWCNTHNRTDLINEYSSENQRKLNEYTYGSNNVVNWVCPLGHKFSMKISDRTVSKYKCPICSNHRLLSGFNDLKTWAKNNNPLIIEEYSKKNIVKLDEIMPNDTTKRIWNCTVCGNEYFSSPNSRVNMGSACPNCAKRMYTSFPEQACYFYVSKAFKDAVNGYKDVENGISELDIFIPSKMIGIEYDGLYWHKSNQKKNKQVLKYNSCRKQGIKLIRIREEKHQDNDDCDISIETSYDYKNLDALNATISKVFEYLEVAIDVNVERDELPIKEQYFEILKSNSLQERNPEVAAEWNHVKNGSLLPNMVFRSSSDVVWWLCPNCGNEYRMRVNTRVGLPIGNCAKCRNHHYGEKFRRAVRQYTLSNEFIAEYPSIKEAKKVTGAGSISICCSGKIQTSGGYKWKYADKAD